jgi:hypothetical protein
MLLYKGQESWKQLLDSRLGSWRVCPEANRCPLSTLLGEEHGRFNPSSGQFDYLLNIYIKPEVTKPKVTKPKNIRLIQIVLYLVLCLIIDLINVWPFPFKID